jgi:hypothetical protein
MLPAHPRRCTSLAISTLQLRCWLSRNSGCKPDTKRRNRLKKPPPLGGLSSHQEILSVIRSQARWHCDDDRAIMKTRENHRSQPHPQSQSHRSDESISAYSQEEGPFEELKTRRAKTPVFAIGQLEDKERTKTNEKIDVARLLAQQYQDVLPPRVITPCPRTATPKNFRKRLRRMKCRESLRDVVETAKPAEIVELSCLGDEFSDTEGPLDSGTLRTSIEESYNNSSGSPGSPLLQDFVGSCSDRRNSSDCETLLGSESDTSSCSTTPASPGGLDFEFMQKTQRNPISTEEKVFSDPTISENDTAIRGALTLRNPPTSRLAVSRTSLVDRGCI